MLQGIVAALAILFICTPSFSAGQKLKPGFHRADLTFGHAELKRNNRLEAGYCAPGMDCSKSSLQSQNPLMQKVAVFGEDRRVYQSHSRGTKLSPIGALLNFSLSPGGAPAVGTAWLIDECYILTAAHNLTADVSGGPGTPIIETIGNPRRPNKPLDLKFAVGQKSDGTFESVTTASIVAMGEFDPRRPYRKEDWALLKLEDCLGTKDRYWHFAVAGIDQEAASRFSGLIRSAGFPGERDIRQGASVDPSCTIHPASRAYSPFPEVWGHDCASNPGNSGGPLLIESKDGRMVAIAMMVSGINGYLGEFSSQYANEAVSLRSILPKIRPILRKEELPQNP